MATTLEQDMINEAKERCFIPAKDDIERDINADIIADIDKKYTKRILAREANLRASAGRGASDIPGWYNPNTAVKMGRETAPFGVRYRRPFWIAFTILAVPFCLLMIYLSFNPKGW